MNEHYTGYQNVEPQLGEYRHGDNRLGTVPLQPDGQWDAFLPEPHQQNENGFEVFDCVSEATINCVEILAKQQYQNTITRSKRLLAVNSGTGIKNGNDPQSVSECLRLQGTVYETDYPFKAPDFNTFFQTLTRSLKTLAIGEFAEFAYGHSWVNADQQSLMNALTYSPLSAAGYAWQFDTQTGYAITPVGAIAEHDFVIYGYVQGQYWKIRDSYAPFEKKLAWGFSFTGVKRHTIQRQIVGTPQGQAWWEVFLEMLKKALNLGDYARNFGATRSPKWGEVRKAFLALHPRCSVCGTKGGFLKANEIHHKMPFHLDASLELNPSNLICLCRPHHYLAGHLMSWSSFNADVEKDAGYFLQKITMRP